MGYHGVSALNWWPAGLCRAVYPDPGPASGDHQIISFVGRLHFTCLLLMPAADLGSQPDGPLVGPLPLPGWQLYWGVVIGVVSVIAPTMC